MPEPNWINKNFAVFREETLRTINPNLVHQAAWLEFHDWLDRRCVVYAERILPGDGSALPCIVHCVGGGQKIEAGDMLFWARQGYACACFDWQIGDMPQRDSQRTSQWPEPVVVQHAPQQRMEQCILPIAIQAAMVTASWLASHPSVNEAKLGMCGISWGGYLTWATAAYDQRIQAICPVYGCGIFNSPYARPHSAEVAAYWKQHWDPQALYAKQSAPAAYLSGTNDFFGDVTEADALLARLPIENRWSLLPNADHSLDAGAGNLASAWMAHYLKDAEKIPYTPILSSDLEIQADASAPIQSQQIWWTNSTGEPRFACWHQAPVDASARMAFAKIVYASGLSLCSRLTQLEPKLEPKPLPKQWPQLADGLGWRWELGSTQFYGNTVKIEALDDGQRLHITPAEKPADHPVALYLRQIQDARWTPKEGEVLQFRWTQASTPEKISAFLINQKNSFADEHEVICSRSDDVYTLLLPEDLKWAEVMDIRIHCHGPREPFTFGPLKITVLNTP
jgi:dienelactone hydrolase